MGLTAKQVEKRLEKNIEQSYYRQAQGIQLNIFSIPKLFRDVKVAVNSGQVLDSAVADVIAKYREN
jgi:hypothetical protein